ncbi:hypothetical protein ACOME3_001099 [Neoechinorhynchus agilis]
MQITEINDTLYKLKSAIIREITLQPLTCLWMISAFIVNFATFIAAFIITIDPDYSSTALVVNIANNDNLLLLEPVLQIFFIPSSVVNLFVTLAFSTWTFLRISSSFEKTHINCSMRGWKAHYVVDGTQKCFAPWVAFLLNTPLWFILVSYNYMAIGSVSAAINTSLIYLVHNRIHKRIIVNEPFLLRIFISNSLHLSLGLWMYVLLWSISILTFKSAFIWTLMILLLTAVALNVLLYDLRSQLAFSAYLVFVVGGSLGAWRLRSASDLRAVNGLVVLLSLLTAFLKKC